MLANTTGQNYGSLGDATRKITINDGATLATTGIIMTDQPVAVSGTATIDVASGTSLTFNKGFTGSGATIVNDDSRARKGI